MHVRRSVNLTLANPEVCGYFLQITWIFFPKPGDFNTSKKKKKKKIDSGLVYTENMLFYGDFEDYKDIQKRMSATPTS